jgi:hypothetical protein
MPMERTAAVEQAGDRSRKRRSRWFTGKFLVLSLAGATLLGGATLVAPQFQDKASAASGDRHFILIATHGAPLWKAAMEQSDGNGNLVLIKDEGVKSGGRVLWEFTESIGIGTVDVVIEGNTISGADKEHVTDLPADRDHCFLVEALGEARYTGDSLTGGCTSD